MGVQVQSATKYVNEEGKLIPLSILNRQFISFSYGEKNIEDFDLLAVFSNDRLDKEIYAPFNDTTTEQAELDGQMFWRSNFKAGQLSFDLATDGMTSVQLQDFKNWFQPGIERELILSEHYGRAILARVASAPQMSLLPFEKEVEVNIAGTLHKTKTSLYKGDIKLEFVMDDPYWYEIKSYVETTSEEDLKLIFEDNVPYLGMIQNDCFCFLANNNYVKEKEIQEWTNSESGITVNPSTNYYLYYCGTAPAKPKISFDTFLIFKETDEDNYDDLLYFKNKEQNAFISLGTDADGNYQKLEFTLPSIFSSWNNAINIVKDYLRQGNVDIVKLRALLRDSLYNYYTRKFTINVIDKLWNDNDSTYVDKSMGKIKDANNFNIAFVDEMKTFYTLKNPLHYDIDCKTGKVTISVKLSDVSETITENAGNTIKSNYLSIDTRKIPVNGKITTGECLLVKSDINLSNCLIDYKYMYL